MVYKALFPLLFGLALVSAVGPHFAMFFGAAKVDAMFLSVGSSFTLALLSLVATIAAKNK